MREQQLYERLVSVEIPVGITKGEMVSAYLRAALVAAECPYDSDLYKRLMLAMAKRDEVIE